MEAQAIEAEAISFVFKILTVTLIGAVSLISTLLWAMSRKVATNEEKINDLNTQLQLNSQRDTQVNKDMEYIKGLIEATNNRVEEIFREVTKLEIEIAKINSDK